MSIAMILNDGPPGLRLLHEAIASSWELTIVQGIERLGVEWVQPRFRGQVAKRAMACFGFLIQRDRSDGWNPALSHRRTGPLLLSGWHGLPTVRADDRYSLSSRRRDRLAFRRPGLR